MSQHEDDECENFTTGNSNVSVYSDLTDTPLATSQMTQKEALDILQRECDSFKSYAASSGTASFLTSILASGYAYIGHLTISLPKLLCTASHFFVFTGGACLATAISAGFAVLLSFIVDVVKCFVNYFGRKYSPNKKKNRKLFLKELKNVVASSFIGAVLSFEIGFIICMFICFFVCLYI